MLQQTASAVVDDLEISLLNEGDVRPRDAAYEEGKGSEAQKYETVTSRFVRAGSCSGQCEPR